MAEDTIHGHPVVAATGWVGRRGCLDTRAVLVDKGDELVTALHCRDGRGEPQGEWLWGRYFRGERARARAEDDWAERARELGAEPAGYRTRRSPDGTLRAVPFFPR